MCSEALLLHPQEFKLNEQKKSKDNIQVRSWWSVYTLSTSDIKSTFTVLALIVLQKLYFIIRKLSALTK